MVMQIQKTPIPKEQFIELAGKYMKTIATSSNKDAQTMAMIKLSELQNRYTPIE